MILENPLPAAGESDQLFNDLLERADLRTGISSEKLMAEGWQSCVIFQIANKETGSLNTSGVEAALDFVTNFPSLEGQYEFCVATSEGNRAEEHVQTYQLLRKDKLTKNPLEDEGQEKPMADAIEKIASELYEEDRRILGLIAMAIGSNKLEYYREQFVILLSDDEAAETTEKFSRLGLVKISDGRLLLNINALLAVDEVINK